MQKSKKYTGVYYNILADGEKSFYIVYNIIDTQKSTNTKTVYKKQWDKVGTKTGGITEAYCNTKRNEVLNKIRLGEEPPQIASRKKKNVITFDEIATLYFNDRALHNRNNDREIQRYNKHIKDILGHRDIDLITSDDLKSYQKEKAKDYAPKTVNTLLGLISVIYNHATDDKKFNGINPTKQVKRLSVDNRRERFLTADEVKLLLESVKENNLLYLFCLIALSTGARLEALLDIQKKDIDLTNETITLKDFKNNTSYKGFISDELYPLLQAHIKTLRQNDYIISTDTTKLKVMNIRDRLQPIINKLFNEGLKSNDAKNRVVVHTLRHTFASHLAINGTPIFTIQKLLNHKDIKMTMRYAKLAPDSGKEMVKGLYR